MSIIIKDITQLPAGTPSAASPFIYGVGPNLFQSTLQDILNLVSNGLTDLSFSIQSEDLTLSTSGPTDLSFNVTIAAGEVKFITLKLLDNGFIVKNTYLVPLGAGTYAPLSATLSLNDLILIERGRETDATSANTVSYTFADLAAVNASDPPIDLSDTTKIYFFNLDAGFYQFIGAAGSYGVGGLTMVQNDLELISEIVDTPQPATGTPPASGTFSVDLSNFFGIDYSASTTSLLNIDIAAGGVLGGFARIKGNWASEPTITGASKAKASQFAPNVDVYLYFEKWADGVVYWFIDELL